jgi:hypothetical protein
MSSRRLLEYLLATMGTATIAALVWFETDPEWVVTGCAFLVLALMAAVWLIGHEIFLLQALILLGVAAFRIAMRNFYHLNEPFSSSLSPAVWAIGVLALAVPLALRVRKREFAGLPAWAEVLARRPEQPMFFVPVLLLVVLLFLKLSGFKMTMAWFAEGFVVFVLALWAKERSFRLTGLALMMLCIGKLGYDTLSFRDPLVRTAAWIGIGLLILVVSFLYGRNRETLRDYL